MTDPADAGERLARFRERLTEFELDGFVVPKADAHQNEYLPASEDRLTWLTGFDGSAGTAVVLADRAALFVDGRYTLQASLQVNGELIDVVPIADTSPTTWLRSHLPAGTRLGFDPWHLTAAAVEDYRKACNDVGATLVAATSNPIDALWANRPEPPLSHVEIHPIEFAGRDVPDKLKDLRDVLADKRADTAVLTHGDAIAWAFNIRARDLAHTPVPLAFALIHQERRPELFVDGRKLSNAVRASIEAHTDVREPAAFVERLGQLTDERILVSKRTTAAAIIEAVEQAGGVVVPGSDPVSRLRAMKNETELAGARAAHRRDGAAMVRFLTWLDRKAPTGAVDEIAAADKLFAFRVETAERDRAKCVSVSFDTISGAGPNGAIVHYRVTPETSRQLEHGSLYLVDSGAQYRDGTTDITRTIAIGAPDATMRDRYTRVLKGHVALSRVAFPAGTSGAQLDALARLPLWSAGLDYGHGTGHGVGSFLSVHEGPGGFSKRLTATLEPGMILSNEPGYYLEGAWGIRIENLVVVKPAVDIDGGEVPVHRFETITLCPYDRRLIDLSLLDADEIAWIDAYHARLPAALEQLLDDDERAWLAAASAPLAGG